MNKPIGIIAGSGLSVDELRAEIRKAREIAQGGVVGVNIMVAVRKFRELVQAALDGRDALVGTLEKHLSKSIRYDVPSRGVTLWLRLRWDSGLSRKPPNAVFGAPLKPRMKKLSWYSGIVS